MAANHDPRAYDGYELWAFDERYEPRAYDGYELRELVLPSYESRPYESRPNESPRE